MYNIDISVELPSGEKYIGTLFTLANVINLKKTQAEFKNYFWASCMVIVDDLEPETIQACVADMIADDRSLPLKKQALNFGWMMTG